MFNWLSELLTILDNHKSSKRELNNCLTCESLKMQLAIANDEKSKLLDRLLNPLKQDEPKVDIGELKPILPRTALANSWRVKQQMLEAEDREKNKILKQNVSQSSITVDELEKELGIVEKERLG